MNFFTLLFDLWSWATLLICFLAWLYLLIGHSATHPQPLSEKIKILRPIREEFLVLKLLPVPKELIFQKKMVSKHLLKVLDEKSFFLVRILCFVGHCIFVKLSYRENPPLSGIVSYRIWSKQIRIGNTAFRALQSNKITFLST